jgi:hypothetical protein
MNAAERGTGDHAALHDMLDAIDMQCAAPTSGAAAGAARPEYTVLLRWCWGPTKRFC